jgi:hypothetical protein
MFVDFIDGQWVIDAPWLPYPVSEATFEAAYWIALKKRAHDS